MIKLAIMLGLTSTFFFVELTVGFITKTLSLVADSFHMLSDALSMVVGIVAIHVGKLEKSFKKNILTIIRFPKDQKLRK